MEIDKDREAWYLNVTIDTEVGLAVASFVHDLNTEGLLDPLDEQTLKFTLDARKSLEAACQTTMQPTVVWKVLFSEAIIFVDLILTVVTGERLAQRKNPDFDIEPFAKSLVQGVLDFDRKYILGEKLLPARYSFRDKMAAKFPGYFMEIEHSVDPLQGTACISGTANEIPTD